MEESLALGPGSLCEALQGDPGPGTVVLSDADIAISRTADMADQMEPKPVKHAAASPAIMS